MGTLAREPAVGDWRTVLIPFFNGSDIEQIRLHLRPYGDEENQDDDRKKGVRFVFDMNLSRLGHMQLDGLVHGGNQRLDLMVRSQAPLPASAQNDIRAIFEEANELTGMNGGLDFQAAPPNFVEIAPPTDPEDDRGLFA
jgi:hypothetical protein